MILEKRLNGLWWFYDAFYTDSFTPYPFGCIIDRSANTFVLTKENRPSYPKSPLPVAEVQIRVLPSTSLETYSTAELLENRLLELGFPPLVETTASTAIPLKGTDTGKPVTGSIEFESESASIKWIDGDGNFNELFFYESGFSFKNNGVDKLLFLNTNQILSLTADSSDVNPTDKLIFAQRAYCEKPETLINALNNASPTQILTIKTILGI